MATSIQRTPGTEHRLDFDAGMNVEHLLTHFDRIADAPDAVPRLRRFILDLAVRGKLVLQDSNDEPASELLKRIAAEKARLVKAGEIRKPRELGRRDVITVLFEIPQSWQWVRLDSVGAIIGGGTPSANEAVNFAEPGQGIPWLTPADLGGHTELFISRGSRDLTEKGLQSSSATFMPGGTVLFTSRAPIGYSRLPRILSLPIRDLNLLSHTCQIVRDSSLLPWSVLRLKSTREHLEQRSGRSRARLLRAFRSLSRPLPNSTASSPKSTN